MIFLSSHETILVAVGENSQYLTQFSCFFNVYWSLLSTVDQTLTNLSSPHVESRSPSQLKPMDLILALWALIKDTYLALESKSTSQNFSDSSLEAETKRFPLGLNLRSWIWFYFRKQGYFVSSKSIGRNLSINIPQEDYIIHSCTRDVFTGWMQVQTHDRLLMTFQRSD